jgi:signal transduction histidine kinase
MAMFIVAAIVFCFWLARPQDKTYGLFALLLIIWGLHNLNLFVSDIPTSAHFWEAMTMSTLGWMVVLMIFFNHRYIGVRADFIERIALIFATLGLLIFALPDVGWILAIGYKVWDSFLIIFGCYAVYILLREFWKTPNQDLYLMLLVGALILALGFHDILLVNHLWDRTDGLIIQYSAIPTLLLFSWFLIRRFVQSIEKAEQLAETLEKRVEQKTNELEQQFDRLQSIKQEQMLAQERERIMRDMHDGIGGQLVSIAASLQDKKGDVFKQLLVKIQSSINDLRMVIDSMDPMLSDLSSLLGNMRPRLEQQITLANISLIWEVTQHAEIRMNPHSNLHISRIIHEAVANAVKHARCDQISISSFLSNDLMTIEIKDNGVGFKQNEETLLSQRGLKNMHFRAGQIGAKLSLQSDGNVTCIRLELAV